MKKPMYVLIALLFPFMAQAQKKNRLDGSQLYYTAGTLRAGWYIGQTQTNSLYQFGLGFAAQMLMVKSPVFIGGRWGFNNVREVSDRGTFYQGAERYHASVCTGLDITHWVMKRQGWRERFAHEYPDLDWRPIVQVHTEYSFNEPRGTGYEESLTQSSQPKLAVKYRDQASAGFRVGGEIIWAPNPSNVTAKFGVSWDHNWTLDDARIHSSTLLLIVGFECTLDSRQREGWEADPSPIYGGHRLSGF